VLGLFMIVVSQAFGAVSDSVGLHNAIFISPASYLASGAVWLAFLVWRARKRSDAHAYY